MKFFKFIIRYNSAKCLLCKEVLVSKSKKLITCKCLNLSIAGGKQFLQRITKKGILSYKELWAIRASNEYKEYQRNHKRD